MRTWLEGRGVQKAYFQPQILGYGSSLLVIKDELWYCLDKMEQELGNQCFMLEKTNSEMSSNGKRLSTLSAAFLFSRTLPLYIKVFSAPNISDLKEGNTGCVY